jgi:ParB family chromosome partitioning protein
MNAAAPPKGRQLGRGLSALLGGDEPAEAAARVRGAATAPVEYLRPSRVQPRRAFAREEIESLAGSIRERGILNPILVRPDPDAEGRFEIVAGERRWRAAQLAQLHEVPVVVRDLSDETALEVALIENVQRQDLNPIEEASGYERLMKDFAHTQESISRIIGKSRAHLANIMRLLSLPVAVKQLIAAGRLSPGHARALLGERDADTLADWVVRQGLSVRQTEKLVEKRRKAPAAHMGMDGGANGRAAGPKDPDTLALERSLADQLGLRVAIDFDPRTGAGRIAVAYKTLEQLDEVIRRLRRGPPMPTREG